MRIAIAGFSDETCTFCKDPTPIGRFEPYALRGQAILDDNRGIPTYINGYMKVLEAGGAEIVPIVYASKGGGGFSSWLTPDCFDKYSYEIRDGLKAAGKIPQSEFFARPFEKSAQKIREAMANSRIQLYALAVGNDADVKVHIQSLLDQGVNAKEILNRGMLSAMEVISGRSREGTVFIPEVLLSARAMKEAGNRVISIMGARSKNLLFWEDKMCQVSDRLIVTTDDGTYGRKGLVTEPLKEILLGSEKIGRVFAIGPAIMMKFASLTTQPFGVPTIVSLNPVMAEALKILKSKNALPGICGRVCPQETQCEAVCSIGKKGAPIAIGRLERFIADWERLTAGAKTSVELAPKTGKKIAIVGSGPAGLACAYDLVRKGYPVTVFEAAPKSGGLLRYGIPEMRLPREIIDNEVSYVQELGAEIKTNTPVNDLSELFNKGYKAVFLATGAGASQRLGIPGEDAIGVRYALEFLQSVNSGVKVTLGKRVAIIGGGNAAIDAARVARRLGAEEVFILYRRTRAEMPAAENEIEEAEREGIKIQYLVAPENFISKDGKLTGVRCVRMELGEPDASGRHRPLPIKGSEFVIDVDEVIGALGQRVDNTKLPGKLNFSRSGTIEADPVTMSTNIDGVFAGGDVVSGPATVINAVAAGKEAAISVERYLESKDLKEGRPFPKEKVKDVPKDRAVKKPRAVMPTIALSERKSFTEVEKGFDESAAVAEANRCLNCGICSDCQQCVEACGAQAIDFEKKDEIVQIDVGGIVVATGFNTFDPVVYGEYGAGKYPDVITGLQMERLLSASGPTEGEVLRPSDHTHPKTVVFISCVGSRDEKMDKPYCSKICCMYMAKQAIMLKEHDPEVQSYVFYIDNRTAGKNFEEFGRRAQEEADAVYLRGRVSKIYQEGKKLIVLGEDSLIGRPVEVQADLVVLSLCTASP